MVFSNPEGHYGFLYQGARTPPRPTRRDYYLNRLLDSVPQPLHVHIPHPHTTHTHSHQYVQVTAPSVFNPHTVRYDVAPYAHSSVPAGVIGDVHPPNPANRVPTSTHQGAEFRRSIYERNQWVRARPGTIFPSPEYFRSDPTVIARVTPWLQREVYALLGSSHAESHVSLVLNAILSFVYRFDIRSRDFRHYVSSYIGTRTGHFQHEFYNFVLSGMRTDEYDCHATYAVQPTLPSGRRISPPPIIHLDISPDAGLNVRTDRVVPSSGHGSVAMQEHNYATPSPTATNREAYIHDHDYMNTRSPGTASTTSSRASLEFGAMIGRQAALRDFFARESRECSRLNGHSQGARDQAPRPIPTCRRDHTTHGHGNSHNHHSHVYPCPSGRHYSSRPSSTGSLSLSGAARTNYMCPSDGTGECCPSHRSSITMNYNPIFGHGPTNLNPAPTTQPPTRPPATQDLYATGPSVGLGVMYAPIGVHMVSPHPHRPGVVYVGSDGVSSRNGAQTYSSGAHHHHHQAPAPVGVDYNNLSREIFSRSRPHLPLGSPLIPLPVEHPANSVNHSPAERPCVNVDFPPSPPIMSLRPERPLTMQDFPVLAVRCNANDRDRDLRNSQRRTMAQVEGPTSAQPPGSTIHLRRQYDLSSRLPRRCTQHAPPDENARAPFSLALRERMSGMARVMVQANERRENVARPQHPGYGVRIEVFPTGTTEASRASYPTYSQTPAFAPVSRPSVIPATGYPRASRSDIDSILSILNSPSPQPTSGQGQFSDDDDCQVVAIQTTPKKPPLDVITLSSDSDNESLVEVPFVWKENNRNTNTAATSTTASSENAGTVPNVGDDILSLEDNLLFTLMGYGNRGTTKKHADQPGPSTRVQPPRLCNQASRAASASRLMASNNGASGSQPSTSSGILEGKSAKKMRLESSSSQRASNSSPIPTPYLKSTKMEFLQQLEADTTRLELALGIHSNTKPKQEAGTYHDREVDDDDGDTSELSEDSDDGSRDDMASSTSAAAAALVGLRYSNPNVTEDNLKTEAMRRSSVIRHTNIPSSSRNVQNSTATPVQESNKKGLTSCHFGQQTLPESEVLRTLQNNAPGPSPIDIRSSDDDSDVEILTKSEADEETVCVQEENTLLLDNGPRDEYSNDVVAELILGNSQDENEDVVIMGSIYGRERRPPRAPVDCVYESLFFGSRNPSEGEPVPMNYSMIDLPPAMGGTGSQDYIAHEEREILEHEDDDLDSCVSLSQSSNDWM